MGVIIHLDRRQEFERWVFEYVDPLVRLTYTYLRDWAASEDAVQDALIRAYQSRDQLRNVDNPFPWLAQIAINECKTIRRRTWREVITELLPNRRSPGAEETVIEAERKNIIHESIMALPESLRTPLYLFYFEDMPTREIADVIGITDVAVRIRLTRARDRVAVELRRREEDESRGKTTAGEISVSKSHGR